MKSFVRLGFVIAALVFFVSGFTSCEDKKFLKRMESHSKSLKSFRADITMEKFISEIGETDVYKGKIIYVLPKERSFATWIQWNSPVEESLVVLDNQFTLYRPRLAQAIIGNINKEGVSPIVSEVLAFMNPSAEQLKANYNIKDFGEKQIGNGTKTRHLEFAPKVAKNNYKSAEFWIDDSGMAIQMKVVENNNDTITILFTNIQKNINVKDSDFKINYPKNTKIVKG